MEVRWTSMPPNGCAVDRRTPGTKEKVARSGGSGFGGFCRNTILSGTKLGALQCARRAEAKDGFGQKSPRVVAPAHPCARDIRTSMCSTVGGATRHYFFYHLNNNSRALCLNRKT